MKSKLKLLPLWVLASLLWALPSGCADEETELGAALSDRSTLYNAQTDTLYAHAAWSVRDTNYSTGGYDYNIVGSYTHPTFGRTTSELYMQVALTGSGSTVDLDTAVIDSVVLVMVKETVFPDTGATYRFDIEVAQLAAAVDNSDSAHRPSTAIALRNGASPFFAETVEVSPTDKELRLMLGGDITTALRYRGDNEGFIEHFKGLRLTATPAGEPAMLTLNFAATATRLLVYYHNPHDTVEMEFTFSLKHPFMHYTHDYQGTALDTDQPVDGAAALYLEPLGGHKLMLDFDSALTAFRATHPTAIIHHADLLLPVASTWQEERPTRVVVQSVAADGAERYVADYVYPGAGGLTDSTINAYRLHVARHMQGLLRNAAASAQVAVSINARCTAAAQAVINGYRGDDPVRMEIVYTE